jgi:hypothetical protein
MAENNFKDSISVFRNDNKTPENRQPEFRGTIELSDEIIQALVDTKSYKIDLALWKREANGKSYLSGAVQLPYALRKEEIAPTTKAPESFDDIKDDIPF